MVSLVTIGWVVGPVLVLYLAGRGFADCAVIAMGLGITLGLVGLRYDIVTSVWCCGRAGGWACLQAWLIVGLGASWGWSAP